MLQDAAEVERIIPPKDAAKLLGVELKTLLDRAWRRRHNLRATRLGTRVIGFTVEDLRAVLARETHDDGDGT